MSKENGAPALIYISPRERQLIRAKRIIEVAVKDGDVLVTYQTSRGKYLQVQVVVDK